MIACRGLISQKMFLLFCLPALIVLSQLQAKEGGEPLSCIPEPRSDWSAAVSEHMTNQAKTIRPSVLFLGDSITNLWAFSRYYEHPGGKEIWESRIAPFNAANFGISGDRTENLLWRITEGKQLEGLRPQVIVLLIGTNNLNFNPLRPGAKKPDTPEEVAAGITKIVEVVRQKQPQATLLLFGIFPRGFNPDNPQRQRVKEVNTLIEKLADGNQIRYIAMEKYLLEADGRATAEVLRDQLHLSPEGYERWANVLSPMLQELLTVPKNNACQKKTISFSLIVVRD